MESMGQMLDEAKALHDDLMKKLAGVLAGKYEIPGFTKDEAIEYLKTDILRMKAILKRYGRSDNVGQP